MSKRQPSPSEHASRNNRALEQAALALQMQRLDEAERLASQVLKSNRGSIPAAGLLGRVLLAQNRADEATDVLQRAARRSEDPELETLFAVALGAAGRDDEAIEQWRRTVGRRPAFPPAFIELGRQLSKAGRFDEGIELLEGGLALAPDHIDLRMAFGFLHLKRNDRARARSVFQGVRELVPQRHDVLILRTWIGTAE